MSIQQQVQVVEAQAREDGNSQDNWLASVQKSQIRANGYSWLHGPVGTVVGRVQYSCADNHFTYAINNVRQPNRKAFIARLETLLG